MIRLVLPYPVSGLTRCDSGFYAASASTEVEVGIGVLVGAARSRSVEALRLFSCLGASSMGGPGGEPQGSPVLRRYANPFGFAHPRLASSGRFAIRIGARIMSKSTSLHAACRGAAPTLVHNRWCVSVFGSPEAVRQRFPRFAAPVDAVMAAGVKSACYFEAGIGAQFYPKTGRVKVWQEARIAAREDAAVQRVLADALLAASRCGRGRPDDDDAQGAGA